MQQDTYENCRSILIAVNTITTVIPLQHYLHQHGYQTELALTSHEVLQKIKNMPSLVLLDIDFEGDGNGLDIAREIFDDRNIPVVFLLSSSSDQTVTQQKEFSSCGFIPRNSDVSVILYVVENTLRLYEATKDLTIFNRLFDNSVNELYMFEQETLRFIGVNRTARSNIGYSENELRSMTPLDIKPEFDKVILQNKLCHLIEGKSERVIYHTTHLRKDGSIYPVEASIQQLDNGTVKLFLITAVDLTERMAIKDEIKQKESVLQAVLESVRDAIVMIDISGFVTLWNSAAELIFGYASDEMIGQDLHKIFIHDVRVYQAFQSSFSRFGADLETSFFNKTFELKASHKNGRELDVEISISPIYISGRPYALSIVHDVSERKQTLAKLEESNKHYYDLAENAPVGILRCDINGKIIYANQNAAETLGSPSVEETKKVNLLTFPLLIKHGFSQKLQQCLRTNISEVYEINYESKWGKKIWLRVHMKSWVESDRITGAQVILDDIAEKKLLEEELRRLSVTDDLTKVYNRRFFVQKLSMEIERSVRYNSDFSLIMLDIDRFKSINDNFGHHAGDIVLKSIAEVIQKRIRKLDLLARWGGEEFVLLIPGTTVAQSKFLAEDLRIRISDLSAGAIALTDSVGSADYHGSITASFGVTEYEPGDTVDTIIQRADNLMYQAKAGGRNKVAI